jgi:Eukaryotic phosphomannomutase
MSGLLHDLLAIVKVAVISGGDWPQFEKQLLSNLPDDERLVNLSLLPTCGTKFFQYTGDWKKIYSEDLSADERTKIVRSLQKALEVAGLKVEKVWGEVVEDRGSQITFSALGQQAPLEEKAKWDSDFSKRKKIKAILDTFIPEFSVRIGGATSIDVTKPGIDKAYGVGKLRDLLRISLKEMIFMAMPCLWEGTISRLRKQVLFLSRSEVPMRRNRLLRQSSLVWIRTSWRDQTVRIRLASLTHLYRTAIQRLRSGPWQAHPRT